MRCKSSLVKLLGSLIYTIISCSNKNTLTLSFTICISFRYLIFYIKLQPLYWVDLEKVDNLVFFLILVELLCVSISHLLYIALIMFRYVFLYPLSLQNSYQEDVLDFVKLFCCFYLFVCWGSNKMTMCFSSLFIWCIIFSKFSISNHPASVWWNMLDHSRHWLLMSFWIQIMSILLSISVSIFIRKWCVNHFLCWVSMWLGY